MLVGEVGDGICSLLLRGPDLSLCGARLVPLLHASAQAVGRSVWFVDCAAVDCLVACAFGGFMLLARVYDLGLDVAASSFEVDLRVRDFVFIQSKLGIGQLGLPLCVPFVRPGFLRFLPQIEGAILIFLDLQLHLLDALFQLFGFLG